MRRSGCAALLGMLVLAACNPQPPKIAATPRASGAPRPTPSPLTLEFSGKGTTKRPIRVIEQEGNRKQYVLQAASYEGKGASGRYKALFQNVQVTFHARDGTTMYADAPRAVVDQSANTVTMQGGVHAHNSAGMTLACDELVYTRTDEKIQGTGHVVITDPQGMTATGSRFTSNIALTNTTMQ